jgi:hypothetical protein
MAAAQVRHLQADARCGEAVRARQQGGAALQEHVDAGLALWMFDRDRAPIDRLAQGPSSPSPELAEANIAALNAGHAYGETAEMVGPAEAASSCRRRAEPGLYRTITGAEAVSLGLVAGAQLAGLPMFFGGYPITPASAILHHLVAAQGIRRHHLPGGGRDRRDLRRDRRQPMPASSASPPRRARASRSRPRRWAWRS